MAGKAAPQYIKDAQERFVQQVDDTWALVTAGTEEAGWNTMTIGWGSAGTLWGLPTATVFVHPWRYTHEFMLREDYFTIQLFSAEYKRYLGILGSKSGRDTDKVALTPLTPKVIEHGMTFEEADVTIVCKKIYTHAMELDAVPEEIRERMGAFYAEDAHTVFVGQIVDVL